MDVKNEDVVFHTFSYTFENSTSTWYFNLHVGSITIWVNFQKYFIGKFSEEITMGALMAELFALVMDPKENVKYFNKIFTIVMNKFQQGTSLSQELQIKVYAIALPTPMSMFIKRVGNNTTINFEE
jgi:hypothetical protein